MGGGRRESFEVRERSEKSSRSPRLVKQIKLRFLKEIVRALWHCGPSCPCRLSTWHREPLAASRSRPARRDARKKAACGLDHAEDAPPDAPPLGAFTWVLAGLPATRGTPSGLSPRAPLLSDSVPCLCPSTVWSSPYSLLGLLSHLSPSAEVSRTQSAQRLFHEGTRLQEKSRAGEKV